MAISAHLFISLALSGFKTLFKSCPEQVPKCYKLFPSLCAFNVSTSDYFRDFMKFCSKITDGFKEFPENIGRLKLEIFMRKVVGQVCRLRGRSPQWEGGSKLPPRSPQWDPPHSKSPQCVSPSSKQLDSDSVQHTGCHTPSNLFYSECKMTSHLSIIGNVFCCLGQNKTILYFTSFPIMLG